MRPIEPVTRYLCYVADPPWKPRDKLPGSTRGAVRQYPCMSTRDICDLAIPPAADDAILFLWRLSSMVEDAYQVCRSWGFDPKSEIVWNKLTKLGKQWMGMGRTVRASHETAIVAVRGRSSKVIANKGIRSTFAAPVPVGSDGRYIHSGKPDAFFELVETLVVNGLCVELFSRRERFGWHSIGNQLPNPITLCGTEAP